MVRLKEVMENNLKEKRKTQLLLGQENVELELRAQTGAKELNSFQQSSSIARLLVQGVQSGDNQILQQVLQKANKEVIESTVRKLPIQTIVPLLMLLTENLHSRTSQYHSSAEWLQVLLTVHASYLSTCPDILDHLVPLSNALSNRVGLFKRMCFLKGRVNLLFERAATQTRSNETEDDQVDPVLYYKDDSEEEMDFTGMPVTGTESDDVADLSEMDLASAINTANNSPIGSDEEEYDIDKKRKGDKKKKKVKKVSNIDFDVSFGEMDVSSNSIGGPSPGKKKDKRRKKKS